MNYGQIKSRFISTLNRRDVTNTQIEDWIEDSIIRSQRLLDVPAGEVAYEITVADGFDGFLIPPDFLRLVSLTVNGNEVYRMNLSSVNNLAKTTGQPLYFCRDEFKIILGPTPRTGDKIKLVYQGNFSGLEADSDTNFLTSGARDIIVAGAMAEACLFFMDPRAAQYEDRFTTGIVDINQQAAREELSNASIRPAYRLDDDL